MKTVSDDRLRCDACGQVHPDAKLVLLHDGREVGNYSEEWRLECEAKFVVNMATLDKRRSYLSAVAEKRGNAESLKLQDRIRSLWNSSSRAAQPQVA